MTDPTSNSQPQTQAGVASAEDGLVILDGPNGLAVTMTAEAASGTGRSLLEAADEAERQIAERNSDSENTENDPSA